ncbi:MAG: hypothetical protein IJK23_14745 [Clostridia bacterium]|nr:hypothetical protein [Clostridia bacterium]
MLKEVFKPDEPDLKTAERLARMKKDEARSTNDLFEVYRRNRKFGRILRQGILRLITSVIRGENNEVFSPATVYGLLLILDGCAKISVQTELERLLDIEKGDAAEIAQTLRECLNRITPEGSSYLSFSAWVDEKLDVDCEKYEKFCRDLSVHGYRCEFSDPETSRAIGQWIADRTKGMLERAPQSDPEEVVKLCSALYFKAGWIEKFHRRDNERRTFHTGDGRKIDCEFMTKTRDTYLFFGDRFTACKLLLNDESSMSFLLPAPDCSPADLLNEPAALDFILTGFAPRKTEYHLTYKIPKFEVSAKNDLIRSLRSLGLENVFRSAYPTIDFVRRNYDDDNRMYISGVEESAKLKIDEDGVCGVSVAELCFCLGIPPELEDREFILDRPFVFSVNGPGDLPLFVGTITDPTEG